MAEETNDLTTLAVEEENASLNSMVRQYLEGRVVELNVKLRRAEARAEKAEDELSALKMEASE